MVICLGLGPVYNFFAVSEVGLEVREFPEFCSGMFFEDNSLKGLKSDHIIFEKMPIMTEGKCIQADLLMFVLCFSKQVNFS